MVAEVGGPRILVVEEESTTGLKEQLTKLGYRVNVASGAEAVAASLADPPDLVLIGIRLAGGVDGIETAKKIRARLGIPVVFATAIADEESLHRAKPVLPFAYLIKPIADRQLRVTIEMALDTTEAGRAGKVTEEEQVNLEQQAQQLKKLESLGVLAGGIAHDFNDLLLGVMGGAELALRSLGPTSPARPEIERIQEAARRAAALSSQMLAYAGRGAPIAEVIDLSATVETIVGMVKSAIPNKAVLRFELARDLPAVEADPAQILQVVMNLVLNSAEALENENGVIMIRTGARECDRRFLASTYVDDGINEGTFVCLEVADTGRGMDSQTRDRIFEPSVAIKSTRSGLGLAAALGIVRGQGGAIKVTSEPGRGTNITVLLPSSDKALTVTSTLEQPVADRRGKGTVLLVDDEEMVRSTAGRMLDRLGYSVLTASDGEEGVELFRARADEISFVLLDLTMPRMGGEEAFAEIRRIAPEAKVILCSGYADDEVIARCASQGMAGFIAKPYRMATLDERIHQALKSR